MSPPSAPERSTTDGASATRHDSDLAELREVHVLADVTAGELWVKASYASLDDLFDPFTAGTGHSGACYAALDRAEQRRLRDQARQRLGDPEATFTLTARAWWARSSVPGR